MADAQTEYGGMASEDIEDWKELAKDILNGTPIIDAVSVVRCKECKHRDGDRCGRFTNNVWVCDEDYCSYGDRKESE